MSSHTRQLFTLYLAQRRAQNHRICYGVICWISLNSCYPVTAFELQDYIFCEKINLNEIVGIHMNNFVCTGLKI